MRHWVLAVSFLCTALAAQVLSAATPGVTAEERGRALEFRKRFSANKMPKKFLRSLTLTYLRRAYVIDVEPAQAVAKILLKKSRNLKQQSQLKYFAWSLDALVRGAKLKDVQTTLKDVLKESYGRTDTPFFLESLLGVAARYASPVPLVKLTKLATNNGMVGRRRRELITWAADQVERGEDPEYILQIYDAIDNVVPSLRRQREYLAKCYDAIRLGAPPLGMTKAVARMAQQLDTANQLNGRTDRILRLYFSGTPLDKALDAVVPPPKIIKKQEDED